MYPKLCMLSYGGRLEIKILCDAILCGANIVRIKYLLWFNGGEVLKFGRTC